MHEIVSDRPVASEITIATIDSLARERVYTPVVAELYKKFVENGTFQALIQILNRIPSEHHPPILHTLTTHVTKEKPVFIYGIGARYHHDKQKVRFAAASTDLLWCLSLMVDDIIDKDVYRANKETAWYVYGRDKTYESAKAALGVLQALTTEVLSPTATKLLVESVKDGLESLEDPVIKSLGSSVRDISCNIDRRARFHCEYPIRALFPNDGEENVARLAVEGLFCVNRAGQILNDVKDLIPSQLYGRGLFTDIRSGTVTVPLVILQEELTASEKQVLGEYFNCPSLTKEQIDWLQDIISIRLPRGRIYDLVSENYRRFLELMNKVVSSEYFPLCQEWVDYKISQASKLLLNSPK